MAILEASKAITPCEMILYSKEKDSIDPLSYAPSPSFKILLTLPHHLLVFLNSKFLTLVALFDDALEGECCRMYNAAKADQGNLARARTFQEARASYRSHIEQA
ncbi:hypothetical protein ACTXT7_013112 [Hymenolepis weldensis]